MTEREYYKLQCPNYGCNYEIDSEDGYDIINKQKEHNTENGHDAIIITVIREND